MRLRQWQPFLLLVLPGIACFIFCMYFALQDWAALQRAYAHFARVAGTSTDMSTLFIAPHPRSARRLP